MLGSLIVFCLSMFWWTDYFPSQDGPIHAYNSYLIAHLGSPAYAHLRAYFEIGSLQSPYWVAHLLLAAPMRACSPWVAERLFLSMYLMLTVGSLAYYGRSKGTPSRAAAFLALPLCFHHLLHMGYWSFSIGIPVFFFTLGMWLRALPAPRPLQYLALSMMLLFCFYCHLVVAALLAAAVVVVSVLAWGCRPRRFLPLFLALSPLCVLSIAFFAPHNVGLGHRWSTFNLAWYLLRFDVLNSFSPKESWFAIPLAVVFWSLLLMAVIERLEGCTGGRVAEASGRVRLWPRTSRTFVRYCANVSPHVWVGLFTLAVYWAVPDSLHTLAGSASVGSAFSQRLAIFPLLAFLPLLRLPRNPRWAAVFLSTAVLASAAKLASTMARYQEQSRVIARYASAVPLISPKSRVLVLNAGQEGSSWRIQVLRHAGSYYSLRSGSVDLGNTFADIPLYPVRFRSSKGRTRPNPALIEGEIDRLDFSAFAEQLDYVVGWQWPAASPLPRRLRRWFVKIHDSDGLVVWRKTGMR
jgi:hypothetical protein